LFTNHWFFAFGPCDVGLMFVNPSGQCSFELVVDLTDVGNVCMVAAFATDAAKVKEENFLTGFQEQTSCMVFELETIHGNGAKFGVAHKFQDALCLLFLKELFVFSALDLLSLLLVLDLLPLSLLMAVESLVLLLACVGLAKK
jgi:hypothetical protein